MRAVTKDPADPSFPHGTYAGYQRGCKCESCTESQRAYNRVLRANRDAVSVERERERGRAKTAKWRSEHPEQARAKAAAYRAAHLEDERARVRAVVAKWRAAHPDRARESERKWQAANREQARASARLRVSRHRSRKRAADTRLITADEWRRLVARFHACCAYCGERRPLTEDHVIPVSRGGRTSIGNILPACWRCNRSKSNKLLVEWRVLASTPTTGMVTRR